MATLALSEKGVATATADYRKDMPVRGARGLILRVEPSRGATRRTWRFRGTLRGAARVWTLGTHPAVSVKDVRKLHADCMYAIDHDEDPQPLIDRWHRSAIPGAVGAPGGPTVRDVVDEFLGWAELKRQRPEAAKKLLEGNLPPDLMATPVAALRKRHFVQCFDRIVHRGSPVLANRVQALVRQAFVIAADRDLIDAVPAMPREPAGGQEKPRERVLDDVEVAALWHGLDRLAPLEKRGKIGRPLAIALKLLLLTGQRRGEVAAARWCDITSEGAVIPDPSRDPKATTFKVWTIPQTKTGNPHAIPLSALACRLLDELRGYAGESDYWLPSHLTGDANAERDRSITRAARTVRAALEMENWTPHDLRRTCRTGLARLGISDAVGERVLNHTSGDRMVAVYNRHRYLVEMREALDKWAAHVAKITAEKAP